MTVLLDFLPQNFQASVTRGGVKVTGVIEGQTGRLKKGDNVVLTARSLTGLVDSDFRQIYNGWVMADPTPITFGTWDSAVRVSLDTSDGMLRGEDLQAIAFTEQASPQNSHQLAPPMKISQVVEHILDSHCNHVNTASNPAGIIYNKIIDHNRSTRLERIDVQKTDNLWGALQKLGGGESKGELFRPFFDRFNSFYYQPSPHLVNNPSLGTLDKHLIKGRPRVQLRNSAPSQRVGQVDLRGIVDEQTIHRAKHPAQQQPGKVVQITRGVWASSLADTQTKAQTIYDWLARPYTLQVEVDPGLLFFGDDGRGLKLYDAVTVQFDGQAENTETGAGVHLQINQKFYLFGYQIRFDLESRLARCLLTLES